MMSTIGGCMMLDLHYPWALWPKRATLWYIRVTAWTIIFLWKGSFKDSIGRHRCSNIAPQAIYRRLDYTSIIRNGCHKWFSMATGESNARWERDEWMFRMSPRDNGHMGQFPTNVSKQAKMVKLSRDIGWHHDAWSYYWKLRWQWDVTLLTRDLSLE